MPPAKFTTSIIVTETKVTYQGRTKSGGTYKLHQVIATKPDGTTIDFPLRSFSELPKHSVIQVECELYTSEQYGASYTLSLKDGGQAQPPPPEQQPRQQGGVERAVRELMSRVKNIEDFLSGRGEFAGSANGSPAEEPTAGPPPPPPPEPAPSEGLPPDPAF